MAKIKCIKIGNHYYPKDSDSVPLEVLFTFLAGDFISSPEWFKKSVEDDSAGTGGNVTFLDKEGGNVFLTLDSVVYGIDVPFVALKQEFLAILNKWEKLYDEGWQEIIITQDDSGVYMVGKNRE